MVPEPSAEYRAPQRQKGGKPSLADDAENGTLEPVATKARAPLAVALTAFFEKQEAAGVSRAALLRKAKIGSATMRDLLKGRTATMRHATLERLAAAAGITVDEMLGTAGKSLPGELAREHMRALLVDVLTFMDRENIRLSHRQFADLVMAIYGVSIQANPAAFQMTPELESIIRLTGKG